MDEYTPLDQEEPMTDADWEKLLADSAAKDATRVERLAARAAKLAKS